MPADLPKDWVSILRRNNALTMGNLARALKHCGDNNTERQAILGEIDRLNAKPRAAASRSKGFGTRNQQRVQIPPEHRFFADHLPHKPWCTNDLTAGLQVRPAQQALTQRYLQYNSPAMVWVIAQDVDRQVDAGYFERRSVPKPNCVVKNPDNGHAHALYFLAVGVCRTSAARLKPLRYLSAIEGALCRQLDADHSFAGLVTKNPLHESWETLVVHGHRYTLSELAEPLDLTAAANEKACRGDTGVGRNVTSFDTVRLWSYSAVRDFWGPDGLYRWQAAVRGKVDEVNRQFPRSLPFSEVKAIAKSISHWTWQRFTPNGLRELIERTHTPELQAIRGTKATNQAAAGVASGQARRLTRDQERATARIMAAQGKSTRQIGAEIGVDQSTVVRWLADQVMHERPISDNSPFVGPKRSGGRTTKGVAR
jgi:hypothetical protein